MFKKAATVNSTTPIEQHETKRTRFLDAPPSLKKPFRLRKIPEHPLTVEFDGLSINPRGVASVSHK
jgi:hypothetical protein